MYRRTRTVYLETKEDRDAIRKADDAEFGPRFIKAKKGEEPEFEVDPQVAHEEPEFESVEAFAEFLVDEDRDTFTFEELDKLQTQMKRHGLLKQLLAYGFKYEGRPKERQVRGFTSNNHNLYQGNPMSGGSGIEVHGVGHRF